MFVSLTQEVPLNPLKNIEEGQYHSIKNESIGDITMKDIEHEMIERTLKKFKHNRRKAAKALDISERTLYRKIKEYDL